MIDNVEKSRHDSFSNESFEMVFCSRESSFRFFSGRQITVKTKNFFHLCYYVYGNNKTHGFCCGGLKSDVFRCIKLFEK